MWGGTLSSGRCATHASHANCMVALNSTGSWLARCALGIRCGQQAQLHSWACSAEPFAGGVHTKKSTRRSHRGAVAAAKGAQRPARVPVGKLVGAMHLRGCGRATGTERWRVRASSDLLRADTAPAHHLVTRGTQARAVLLAFQHRVRLAAQRAGRGLPHGCALLGLGRDSLLRCAVLPAGSATVAGHGSAAMPRCAPAVRNCATRHWERGKAKAAKPHPCSPDCLSPVAV